MKDLVILVYPKIHYKDNYPFTWVPYSILSLSKAIKNEKKDVEVVNYDCNVESNEKLIKLIENEQDRIVFIGFSIMTGGGQIEEALSICANVKKINKNIVLCFGGAHVNVLPEETLKNNLIDDVLQGPGQQSIPRYIDYLLEKIDAFEVPGLYSKRNNKILRGSENILTVNAMMGYDFEDIDLSYYIKNDETISSKVINYIGSQGCVYNCAFCYESSYKRKYCSICEEQVKKDISYFFKIYNINGVKFSDADFFTNIERAKKIIKFLSLYNLKWAASAHPNDIKRDKSILEYIASSGCTRILMGIESGNDNVLNKIVHKNVTVSEIWDIAKSIADYGILGSYTFVVGFPGETFTQQLDTFRLIEKLWTLSPRPETKVHLYLPYPGTPLYEDACNRGFCPPQKLEEWSDVSYYETLMPWVEPKILDYVKEYTDLWFKKKR
ncbi:MAG: B12-binding domain-containing radical SAM protein [Lachnospiraceae bacterium]|nr:B12-binding domain-containing radical SAM protein [Lachnospiraceae bacterium]